MRELFYDFEVLQVKRGFASRLERMLDHGRASQVHEAVLSQATTEYFKDDVGFDTCLRTQHECFRDGLDDERDEYLVAGFDNLAGARRAAIGDRLAKD